MASGDKIRLAGGGPAGEDGVAMEAHERRRRRVPGARAQQPRAAIGPVEHPDLNGILGASHREELRGTSHEVGGDDASQVRVGDRCEARALLQVPHVQRAARARRDEQRLAVGPKGERRARVARLVGEGEHGLVHLEVVEDDLPVSVADADDVERRRLLDTQHGRAPARELIHCLPRADVEQVQPAIGRAEHDLVEVCGRVREGTRREARVQPAEHLAGAHRPHSQDALLADAQERLAEHEQVANSRRVLAVQHELEIGAPVDVDGRAAGDNGALARRAQRAHRAWQLRAHEAEAQLLLSEHLVGAADGGRDKGLGAELLDGEGHAVAHEADGAVRD